MDLDGKNVGSKGDTPQFQEFTSAKPLVHDQP
jgi:hypothetical protein